MSQTSATVPTRSAMPRPGLPNGGMRTWSTATRSPTQVLDTPPNVTAHLLKRMTFGLTPQEYDRVAAMSPEDFIMEQTIPHIIDDGDCYARIAALGHETGGLSLSQLWGYRSMSYPQSYSPWWEVREETILRMAHSKRQLFEVMVDFWHNHFNIRAGNYPIRYVWRSYDRDVIRFHAMKNFRAFIQAVGTHTAMLYSLDNYLSTDAGPNENYARELFELHTLGAEHYLIDGGYVDDDVYEAARCFTGWTVSNSSSTGNTGEFLYREDDHDRFQKVVLGHSIPRDQGPMVDGLMVYDLLGAHPLTHRHIALRLCQRFIADNPPESIVNHIADVFGSLTTHEWQITITLQELFRSQEFMDSWHGKIRRPLDHLVAGLRAMGGNFTWTSDWDYHTRPLGHTPFEWPAPDGFPDDAATWVNTNGMLHRWNVINEMANGEISGLGIDLHARTPAGVVTPRQLVDYWVAEIMRRTLSETIHTALLDFVSEGRNPDLALPSDVREDKINPLVALICSTPEFQYR